MDKYESAEYQRSRTAYIVQSTVEYFVSLLVVDAFLAKLLSSLGISDSLIGIISSFITLAFVIQFFSIFIVRIKMSTKYLVMLFDTLSIVFFMLMYFTPFVPLGQTGKTIMVMGCILFAYITKYLVISVVFKWCNSYVNPKTRASYSATKEMISLISGMAFTAAAGYIIDRYEGLGNLNGGFLFIAVTILILNICNFICFALIKKEAPEERLGNSAPLSVVFSNTIGNKDFRNVIILTVMFDIARYSSVGFMGIYKTKDLMLSAFAVQLINIISNVFRMIISKPLGRFSDKYSFAAGFRMGLCIAAAAFFINIFTTKSSWFLIIVYSILYNCSVAGTNQNSYNITYSYVKPEYITQAMAIKNCIGGLFGFGTSVVAGKILSLVQANGNAVMGIPMNGQQLLSGMSFVFMLLTILFMNKTLLKKKDGVGI